jgi:hypothetical protein
MRMTSCGLTAPDSQERTPMVLFLRSRIALALLLPTLMSCAGLPSLQVHAVPASDYNYPNGSK